MSVRYATFWRCALQVNPHSYNKDSRNKEHGLDERQYNQAILEKCRARDVKVVGIADHCTVHGVDALRGVLEPAGIVVFPGFEITSTEKIHMVCLFREGTTAQQLERILGKLDITDPNERVCPSGLPCLQIAELVRKMDGFWYAAHMTQKNGLIYLMKDGGGLTHVWRQHELVKAGQIQGSLAQEEQGHKDIITNKDPTWQRERAIAVINARDIAAPEDLDKPGATCLVKMTKRTFDAFRQAFQDHESRVRLESDLPPREPGRILSLRVNGGYLDGLDVELSPHLNAVIGGRGTGKSTLLELLRFAFDVRPKGKSAQKLHDEIIKENLGREQGEVRVEMASFAQHGRRYLVTRKAGGLPVVRDQDGAVSALGPRDLAPALEIYGQNEIYELAHDPPSRLQLLSRFLPAEHEYATAAAQLRTRLEVNARHLQDAQAALDDVAAQRLKLHRLNEQLTNFGTLGIETHLASAPLLAREKRIAGRASEEVERLRDFAAHLDEHLPDLAFLSDAALEGLPNAAHLIAVRATLSGLTTDLQKRFAEIATSIEAADKAASEELARWKAALDREENEIETALRSLPDMAGKSGPEVGVAYQSLLKEIEKANALTAKQDSLGQVVEARRKERASLLAELTALLSQRSESLRSAARHLNRQLDRKLKVTIVPSGDRGTLKSFLVACELPQVGVKRLEWVDTADDLTPIGLAEAIRGGAAVISARWREVTPMVAEALARMPQPKVLELEAVELKDRVEIELNVAHAGVSFKALDHLSTGQQCTAILHMLLLENGDPLIVDQPEDNLDNAFIADRIVHELRRAKTSRQFLFATHNANIPVFGDAEWIGVFTASETRGKIEPHLQGSIDVPAVRDQVALLLEGGKQAFLTRKVKYGY